MKMIHIENIRNKIYLFGREGRTPYVKKVDFKPYFYVKDNEGEFITISGEKVSKKVTNTPDEIPKMRDKFQHQEADIIFVNRYLIDEIDDIPKEEIRKCFIDMEVDSIEGFSDVQQAMNRILIITCYDNFMNKYISFIIGNEKKIRKESNWSIYIEETERDVLEHFIDFIESINPDMLIAWNGDRFDFPYLIHRCFKLANDGLLHKESILKLSRLGQVYMRGKEPIIKGRILFDLMLGYRKLSQGERESYALEYISQLELGEGKEKHPYDIKDFYYKDWDLFLKYNKRDVELMVLLDEKLKIIDFFDEIRRLAKCTFLDVFQNSKVVDCLVLKEAKKKGVVLPSKQRTKDEVIEGAYVHQPNKELYENIAVLDMKSLYPSIMITFNIGYETFLKNHEEDCIDIDGKYFYSKNDSLIKRVLKGLLREREKLKAEMRKYDFGSVEYRSLNLRQYAVKVIANSIYGVIGYSGFRLFNSKVAETITYMGRRIIHYIMDFVKDKGFETIYSDTDSVFIKMGDKSVDDVRRLVDEINSSFDDFVKQFNVSEHVFEIQFEKVYKTILFTGVKKRYAGKLRWKDGKEVCSVDVVGFEARRSDMPEVGREFQKKLFELVLDGKGKGEILKYIEDFKRRIREEFTPEQIALPIGISKENYKNTPIHIRAVSNANRYHNANLSRGDRIKYLYVKSGKCKDNVIAFKDRLWEGYEVDYDKMVERIIDNKVDIIFEALGWNRKSRNLMEFLYGGSGGGKNEHMVLPIGKCEKQIH